MATTLDEPPIHKSATGEQPVTDIDLNEAPIGLPKPIVLAEAPRKISRQQSALEVRKILSDAVESHRQGEISKALQLYHQALDRDPNNADAWHLVGVISVASRKHAEAAEHLERALKLRPNAAEYHATMAQIQAELSDWNRADTHARNALALNAKCPAALHAMGLVHCHRGDIRSACRHFRDAVVGEPTIGRVWLDYGDCLNQLELYEESLEALQKALELMPDSPLPLNSLGTFWSDQGDTELALDSYRESLQIDNELPVAHSNIANLYRSLGRTSDAIAHYRRLLKLDDFAFVPSALNALSELARSGEYEFSDDELDQIEELCLTPDMSERDLSLLHFARARVFEHEELYDDAFEDYALANQYRLNLVRRSGYKFQPEAIEVEFDAVIRTFTPELFARARSHGIGNNSVKPIFLVGFPRGGTGVVEKLLTTHPQIASNGQLDDIDRLAWRMLKPDERATASPEEQFPQWLHTLDSELLSLAAGAYLDHVTGIAPDADRIIDCTPRGFVYAGFMALMFPQARIIHCHRDPRDVSLSNFTHSYSDPLMASIGSSLESVVSYYQQYARLMAHWKAVLPVPMLEVSYEDVARKPADEYNRVLDAVGIKHETSEPEFTWLRTDSVNRGQKYGDLLQPLAELSDRTCES